MTNEIIDLARRYGEVRAKHGEVEKQLKELAKQWDQLESDLADAMIDAGVSSVAVEGFGRFQLSRSSYPSVNAAQKPQFYEYLKASGNGDLLRLDVPAPTLNAFLKRHKTELEAQFVAEGLTAAQAARISGLRDTDGNLPYADAAKAVGRPMDEMLAEEMAIALLKANGAAMFSKKGVSLYK